MMAVNGLAVATRSIPIPRTESESGITWPPEEKLELLWFEKSAPPEDVAENFRIVPLDEIGAHPGTPVEPTTEEPEPGDTTPAEPMASLHTIDEVARFSPVQRREPVQAARAPQAQDEFEPVIAIQRAPQPLPPRVDGVAWALATVLAVSAFGLLLLIVGVWWRWSAPPSQELAQGPPAAAAASEVAPPTRSSIAPPTSIPAPAAREPAAREPQPVAPVTETRAKVKEKARANVKPPAKSAAAKPTRQQVTPPAPPARTAKSTPAPVPPSVARPADIPPPAPVPEATVASMSAQPTIGAPAHVEEPPARPAPRAPTPTPVNAPAPSNARTASVVTPPSDEQRIRTVLRNYQAAFEQFDPGAVQAVWPSVDKRALGRAFDGLSSQSIVFDRCDVNVAAASARAACRGGVEYVKRVGGGGTQSAKREWVFDLQKSADGAWRIQSLTSH
jgi:hypothetical protein